MPFHVEISGLLNRARVLNVEENELRSAVLEPWVSGLPFEFGERNWRPRESRLTILAGPVLDEAGHDEGWSKALRAAEDVTRTMLEAAEADAPAKTAVLVEADSVETALDELRSGQPPQQIPWASAVKRLGGQDADVKAVILVVKPAALSWPRL